MNILSDATKARVIEFVRTHPCAEMDQIDDAVSGILIYGFGGTQEVKEEEFDEQMVGSNKPLLKDGCFYSINPNFASAGVEADNKPTKQ